MAAHACLRLRHDAALSPFPCCLPSLNESLTLSQRVSFSLCLAHQHTAASHAHLPHMCQTHSLVQVVLGKSGLCGFTSTNLPFILQHNGIKNVALAGFLVSATTSQAAVFTRCYTVPDSTSRQETPLMCEGKHLGARRVKSGLCA